MGTFACTTLQHLILRDSVGLTWFDYVWLFSWQCFPSSPATHTVVADRSSLESQVLEKRPSWKDWHDASLMEMCRRPWRTRRWANQLAVGQHFATLKHGIAWPRSWQTGIYWNNMNEYFEFYIFELWVNRSLFTNITHTHIYIYTYYVYMFVSLLGTRGEQVMCCRYSCQNGQAILAQVSLPSLCLCRKTCFPLFAVMAAIDSTSSPMDPYGMWYCGFILGVGRGFFGGASDASAHPDGRAYIGGWADKENPSKKRYLVVWLPGSVGGPPLGTQKRGPHSSNLCSGDAWHPDPGPIPPDQGRSDSSPNPLEPYLR